MNFHVQFFWARCLDTSKFPDAPQLYTTDIDNVLFVPSKGLNSQNSKVSAFIDIDRWVNWLARLTVIFADDM